jgi:hypothetical protein
VTEEKTYDYDTYKPTTYTKRTERTDTFAPNNEFNADKHEAKTTEKIGGDDDFADDDFLFDMDEELNKDKDLIYGGDDGSDPSSISISATI